MPEGSRVGRLRHVGGAIASFVPAGLASACFAGESGGGKQIEPGQLGWGFLGGLIGGFALGAVVGGIVVAVAAVRRKRRAPVAGAAPERSALRDLAGIWLKTSGGVAGGVALTVVIVGGLHDHLERSIGYPYSALISVGTFALYLAVALYALCRPARERRLHLAIPGAVAAFLFLPGFVLWLIRIVLGRG